jgi:cytochrome c biogenesis protein CcmG/thiol:disulfide interchange protein DsbE
VTDNRLIGTHRSTARRLTVLFVVNTVLLLAALGGLLWVVNQPLGSPADEGLTLDGEVLLKEEAARSGVGEGQLAPGFAGAADGEPLELASLTGELVPLSDFRGRPVWVVFWATYCHACQLEEADMRRAFDAYGADGLTLLAIDVGEDSDVVRRYAEERDLPWTIVIDDSGATVDAFGAIGTPSHFFIATDGTIQSRAFGRLRYAEMDEHLASLIDDRQGSTGGTAG